MNSSELNKNQELALKYIKNFICPILLLKYTRILRCNLTFYRKKLDNRLLTAALNSKILLFFCQMSIS